MEGKQITLKLSPVEVSCITEALEKHRGSVTDTTPVETTLALVRFRQHNERLKNQQ